MHWDYKHCGVAAAIALIAASSAPALASDVFGFYSPFWSQRISVNCDRGQSLKRAVERFARRGTTIRVKGTCGERITIRKDDITIMAAGSAVIDGSDVGPATPEFNALITVDGARRVVLDGLAVQNSSAEGVIVRNNASAVLRNMMLTANGNVGLLVDDARAELKDVSATGNLSGMDSINNASVVFRGNISLVQNFVFGVGASNGSALELRGAALDISHNGLTGAIIEGGHMAIFNFGVAQGSSIVANQNGLCGMVAVGGGRLDIVAPPPFQNTGINQVTASNNIDCGIWLAGNGYLESPFGAATFTIANNPVGIRAEGDSSIAIVGGMQLMNNTNEGLLADGAGVITIVSSEGMPSPNPSSITGNGTDVSLNFGSRATFGALVGTIVCDGTSLARGSITCP